MTAPPKSSRSRDTGIRAGDVIAGKYRVERVLGQGGMGVVVAAIHTHLDERVAVKLLRPDGESRPDFAERFMREARTAVKIKSAHVCRVIDVGTEPAGRPYMVMEYLEGRDLGEELTLRGPLPEAVAVEYVLEACDALAEAHALGIVHRDLKPGNLFLSEGSDVPVIKVLDFGISKVRGDRLLPDSAPPSITAETMLLGSPFYMSPEQIRSAKDVDQRADVWALGVILHELVAGQTPFSAPTASAVLAAICADPPVRLSVHRPGASKALENVITSCLEKDRDRRIRSVPELVSALAPFSPDKAATILERIERLGQAGGRTTAASNPGRVSFGSLPNADILGDTVGSFTHTKTRVDTRRRSILLFAASAGLLAAFGTFVVLTQKGDGASSGAAPATLPAVTNSPAIAPSPNVLPTAAPAPAEPAEEPPPPPTASASASPLSSAPRTGPAIPSSAKPISTARPATTPGAIRLGKEVETRR